MTTADLLTTVRTALLEVAPEADPATLAPDVPLQDQLDLDSMDFLAFLTELAEATGVEVPEEDYAAVATLNGCVAYLERHAESRA